MAAIGEWRSLVARLLWEQDAAGSNPVSPMRLKVSPQLTSLPLRKGRFFVGFAQAWAKPADGNPFLGTTFTDTADKMRATDNV